ncbi:general transcription factor IIH subunit 3-like [Anneissia japonica]|uniref:general transcription factor IIH subunit 3-like n=1 Tax=Anneissia japonica TaxID=1529436 RepID=UPI001425B62E|nr:general transcription factor IIH subunit 3-like [Anneissia japonica]
MAEEEDCDSLVVIVDVNPVWWGQRSEASSSSSQITLTECMENILVFVNSHLMMKHTNQVAVIASHTNESRFLYPKPNTEEVEEVRSVDGKYELFTAVDDTIMKELRKLMTESQTGSVHTDTLLSGSLAMALCYIHKLEKQNKVGTKSRSRILVIKASDDSASQYMNFMNVIFTAQKQNVLIDACILGNDSGLLQQACDISHGIYLKVPQVKGLVQYLLWVFLPSASMRDTLVLPPAVQVDYRAACFCHRTLIDVGYVCSVCLSIFCQFSPICSTCHTAFKFMGLPSTKSKKKKSSLAVTS